MDTETLLKKINELQDSNNLPYINPSINTKLLNH